MLGRQTSLCVVSNGAECILLDKQYYRQHAPEDLMRRVRQEVINLITGSGVSVLPRFLMYILNND